MSDAQTTESLKGFFGSVTDVKCVRSLNVTRIVIEVPAETHVAATQSLFGRDVFMMTAPEDHKIRRYGPLAVDKFIGALNGDAPDDVAPNGPQSSPHSGPRDFQASETRPFRGRGLVPNRSISPSRWLGIECQRVDFITWIGAKSADEAAAIVRSKCGVTSRADIEKSPAAMAIFVKEIMQPWQRKQHEDLQ